MVHPLVNLLASLHRRQGDRRLIISAISAGTPMTNGPWIKWFNLGNAHNSSPSQAVAPAVIQQRFLSCSRRIGYLNVFNFRGGENLCQAGTIAARALFHMG